MSGTRLRLLGLSITTMERGHSPYTNAEMKTILATDAWNDSSGELY